MKNEASKTRTLDIAFVVHAEHLRRLAVILGETSDKLEYTVGFSDGTSVHYGDIEDIIGQPNSKERSIVFLIAGTADDRSKSGFVTLKKDGSPSLEYTIYGSQRDVVYFANQLDDWVSGVRQWYSMFVFSEEMTPLTGLLAIVVLLAPFIAWGQIEKLSPAIGKGGSYQWVALPAIALMGFVEYGFFRVFPRGTFAVGRGEQRSRFYSTVRYTVLTVVVLGILVDIIANWITRRL